MGWAQDTLQDERAREQAQAALVKLHKLEPASVSLPGGAGAWAVRVIRTGGFDGRTVDVAVRSTGAVRCALSGTCTGDLSGNSLQSINALVAPVPIPEIKSELSGACNDCFITRITMRRRESDGTEKIYFAYWDDVTMTRAPSELVRIAQAALALQR
jgi:Fe-S cluster biogenesis protein NfuA